MKIRAAGVSRKGLRPDNQDALGLFDRYQIFAVADGMGGLKNGDRASGAAIAAIGRQAEHLARTADLSAKSGSAADRRALFGGIEELFQHIGGSVYAMAEEEGDRMGSTLSMVVVAENHLTIGHVGDTRVYLVRGRKVELLTSDHSLAALRYRRGTLSLEDYYTSPLRNVLYEFLGHEPEVAPDVVEAELQDGDRLVLCTDGVWDYLGNDRLAAIATLEDPSEAAGAFVDEALSLGSDDNCSCAVLQIQGSAAGARLFPAKALSESMIFEGMSRVDLRLIAPFVSMRTYSPGERIIQEGDVGEELFIIANGEVDVRRKGVSLVRLTARAHFGELALTNDTPRSASVFAVGHADLVVLDRSGLNTLAEKRPELANRLLLRLLNWVGERLIEMTERAVKAENHIKLLRSGQ